MKYARYWSRRNFLKSVAASGVTAATIPVTTACTSIGRVIEGDNAALTDRVVIVGGGISGLVAARELKKNSIPFRLFEGSQRIGGRCLSLDDFNQAAQIAELGAEWISEDHEFVKNICHELHVELLSTPESSRNLGFYSEGKVSQSVALNQFFLQTDQKLATLREKLNDQQWDALSAEEMIAELKHLSDERTTLWIRRLIQLEWGCDPHQISALQYFDRFRSSLSGSKKMAQNKLKIKGGSGLLAKALYDRIAGVIPGQLALFEHKLIEVDRLGDDLELTFQAPKGEISVRAKVVILALPFSVLRNVRGLDQVGISELKLKAIQQLGYGQHGKYVASFKDRFWSKKNSMMTGDLDSQWIWESSVVKGGPMQTTRGLLTAQLGGHAGAEMGLQQFDFLKSDLTHFSLQAMPAEESIGKSWALDPWAKGSVSYFAPGQALLFPNVISAPEKNGLIIFAGEHTSSASMGTLNGAVESGLRAALEALRMKGELTKKII